MLEITVFVLCFFVATLVNSQDIHAIETKVGLCYKIHNPDQPNFYPNPRRPEYKDLHESCTEWLQEDKNCLGLRTQNNEVIVLSCKGARKRNRPGCYKIINNDKREEIVCQKLIKREGCEVLTTKTNLNVVIYCLPRSSIGVSDAKVKKRGRE